MVLRHFLTGLGLGIGIMAVLAARDRAGAVREHGLRLVDAIDALPGHAEGLARRLRAETRAFAFDAWSRLLAIFRALLFALLLLALLRALLLAGLLLPRLLALLFALLPLALLDALLFALLLFLRFARLLFLFALLFFGQMFLLQASHLFGQTVRFG